MSTIAEELEKLQTNVNNIYESLETKGATIPEQHTLANIPTAVETISGGGGGDLSKLGKTVTVKTSAPIYAGQKFKGVKNTEELELAVLGSTPITSGIIFCEDLKVGIGKMTGSSTTEIKIFFWNEELQDYESQYLNVEETGTVGKSSTINEDGTLAIFGGTNTTGTYTAAIFEINRETKEIQVYTQEFTGRAGVLYGDYLMYPTDNTSTNRVYKYNRATHQFDLMNCMNAAGHSGATLSTSDLRNTFKWLNDNTLIIITTGSTSRIGRIVFTDTSYTVTSATISRIDIVSNDLQFAAYYNSSKLNLYSLDINNLKSTLIISADWRNTAINNSSYGYMILDGKLFVGRQGVYDISNIQNNVINLIIPNTEFTINVTSVNTVGRIDSTRFIASDTTPKIMGLLTTTNAEYIIEPYFNDEIETGHSYGIASHNISFNETGTAQLLFTSEEA